ncbi:MAG: DRTGG domain-containing protein [Dehalococcoidales bacterium]|jgi:BioD-like phosphotransacetylase family protein
MNNIIIGSVSENSGKTSFIIGLAKAAGKKFGYLKPFGDKLIYRKKRLWDYDAALITNIFGLQQSSDEMTIGFEHAKLRYMYDEAGTKAKLLDMVRNLDSANELLIIEGGKELSYGASVRLDTLSLVKYTGGKLVLVVSGDEGRIIDDITFIKTYVDMAGIDCSVIINKIKNLDDYKASYLPDIKSMGVNVLGVIPDEAELTYPTMAYLAEKLQARTIAGESGLKNRIKHIFIGSKSADTAVRDPRFNQQDKLIIASGDRSDYIASALVVPASGIILTNNILPPPYLLTKLSDASIPVLLVPYDTYETAKQIDEAVPLLTRDDADNIRLLQTLVEQNVDIKSLLS